MAVAIVYFFFSSFLARENVHFAIREISDPDVSLESLPVLPSRLLNCSVGLLARKKKREQPYADRAY